MQPSPAPAPPPPTVAHEGRVRKAARPGPARPCGRAHGPGVPARPRRLAETRGRGTTVRSPTLPASASTTAGAATPHLMLVRRRPRPSLTASNARDTVTRGRGPGRGLGGRGLRGGSARRNPLQARRAASATGSVRRRERWRRAHGAPQTCRSGGLTRAVPKRLADRRIACAAGCLAQCLRYRSGWQPWRPARPRPSRPFTTLRLR